MVLASLVAIMIGLVVTLVSVRLLYKFSLKKGLLNSRRDYVINGVIVAFVFFCVSSIVYVVVLNI
jgi:hypothetical protein